MDRFDDEGGIAPWAIRALGFDEPCQCGHDWGHHQAPGTECVVLDCTCASFRAFTSGKRAIAHDEGGSAVAAIVTDGD